jgi:DNA-binding MarR family transcriptional regulator
MATKKIRTALFDRTIWADEVMIRAIRLGDAVNARLSLFFAEYGLTILQFNVLRILYVQDENNEGIPAGNIKDLLIVRGPDVTRLLDRLEKADFIERLRHAGDRRVVKVRLTRAGTALVEKVHEPLIQHNIELLSGITEKELKTIARQLSRVQETLAKH